jgi:hypothetical protein
MADDKDRIAILLAEYSNHTEWQRHNENQRAQLTNILLAISAAIITLIPKDRPLTFNDWPVGALLIGIGVFGFLAVMKYWERFLFHVRRTQAIRTVLDSNFSNNWLINARNEAVKKHNKGWRPLLKDKYFKQHWLWEGVFVSITMIGFYFLGKAFQWF